jgi:predicted DNA-binding transcriptional regulator AlpA
MNIKEQQFPPMLRMRHLEAIFGIRRNTIYRHIRLGNFPPPHKGIIGRAAYWPLDEIRALLDERLAASLKA